MRRALICGVSGQDGASLPDFYSKRIMKYGARHAMHRLRLLGNLLRLGILNRD